MIQRLSPRRRHGDGGFTLIELLVVIVVLGILAGVVVFATGGVKDRGEVAADKTDENTLRTAQEAFFAQNGRYATEQELVESGFLASSSTKNDIGLTAKKFMIGYGQPNDGSVASWDVLTLSAGTGNGFPTPFQSLRGPGNANTNYMFDPLFWRDATGEPLPWLATAYERSANGLQWTFDIRPGVKWQDGANFSAADVKFTYDFYKTPEAFAVQASQQTTVRNKNTLIRDNVTSVAVIPGTPEKVVFTLNAPLNTFMTRFAQSLLILPQHIWSTITNPTTAAPSNANVFMGTGAYVLQNPTTYDPSTGVSEYVANPNFFGGVPFVKKLRFVTVTDEIGQLLNGTVSSGGIGSEESVTPAALAQVTAAGFQKLESPGGWNRALHFNGLRGFPYNNATFRKAVAYTVDRAGLLQNIVGGRGEMSSLGGLAPSHGFLAPNLPSYARDVAQSNSLLDSLGIVDGPDGDSIRELPATFAGNPVTGGGANFNVTLYTSDRFSTDTVEAVQQYLLDVGLASTYVVEPSGTADLRAGAANYDMAFVGYGNLTADPDQLRTRFTGNTPGPNGSFSAVWGFTPTTLGPRTGMTYAALAAQQLIEPSEATRKDQLWDMQDIVAAEVPVMPLYIPYSTIFSPPGGFSAWYQTPGGTPPGPPGFSNKHVFITGKQFGLSV